MSKILAVDDGSFKVNRSLRKNRAFLIGVLVEDNVIEKVLLKDVIIDGLDATEKVCEMIKEIKTDFIMLPSVSCAGFNLYDAQLLYDQFKIPLLIVNPRNPDNQAVEVALRRHFYDWEHRLSIIRKIPELSMLSLNGEKKVYFSAIGISLSQAKKLIQSLTFFGNCPEPLRIVRLIAQGLGEFDLKRPLH